ncbi:MAG: aminoacyl-tRNA hydrolase [Candidatus Pacebacteria bacterium]|nr:aminoacyl-tRNA hydrolase [Candidatus Paceibacterota bacterium]
MWNNIKKKFLGEGEKSSAFLIVGLGNPKEKYEKTVHNVGFRVVSFLQEEEGFPLFSKDNTVDSLVSKGFIDDKEVVLIKPLSFMNLSGGPVKKAVKKFNTNFEKLIVVHDDTDLPVGKIRFSYSRGAAGHNGVLSVIKAVGTKDFWRLRVGVSQEGSEKAKKIVLKKTSQKQLDIEKDIAKELKKTVLLGLTNKTVEIKVDKIS